MNWYFYIKKKFATKSISFSNDIFLTQNHMNGDFWHDQLTCYICLFVCSCFTSPHQQQGHLLSLAKDVKLGKYTVPTGTHAIAENFNT